MVLNRTSFYGYQSAILAHEPGLTVHSCLASIEHVYRQYKLRCCHELERRTLASSPDGSDAWPSSRFARSPSATEHERAESCRDQRLGHQAHIAGNSASRQLGDGPPQREGDR